MNVTPREKLVVSLVLAAMLIAAIIFGNATSVPNERIAAELLVFLQIAFLVWVVLTPAKENTISIG